MRFKRPMLFAALVMLALIATWFTSRWSRDENLQRPDQSTIPRFDRFYIKGFDYTATSMGQRLFAFKAEELTHRKRRIGPLTLNPIKEIEVVGMDLTLYGTDKAGQFGEGEQDNKRESFASIPMERVLEEITASQNLGSVSRVLVRRIVVSFIPEKAVCCRIVADTAKINPQSDSIDFDGNVVLEFEGDAISADRATWSNRSREVRVPGDYVVNLRNGQTRHGRDRTFIMGKNGSIIELPPR